MEPRRRNGPIRVTISFPRDSPIYAALLADVEATGEPLAVVIRDLLRDGQKFRQQQERPRAQPRSSPGGTHGH